MNENHIVESILKGDDDVYAQLVERYHVGLIIHCERLVGDRDDAEDVAQEAFIKAYKNLKSFDYNKSRFSTWLYKIATNTAIDHLRKNKRSVAVEDIELLAQTTEPAILKNEEQTAVREAVLKLMPPEYRLVIEAYYWRGLSYEQIAAELGKPVSTIGTYIRRAKLRLKGDLLWLK